MSNKKIWFITGASCGMDVTRAVLPVMRKQRLRHMISISSSAGLSGFEFGTAYAASKFGLEGWMPALRPCATASFSRCAS
jgi:NADP-dependent 3-hydroxy acid dehydrogenase YdfG